MAETFRTWGANAIAKSRCDSTNCGISKNDFNLDGFTDALTFSTLAHSSRVDRVRLTLGRGLRAVIPTAVPFFRAGESQPFAFQSIFHSNFVANLAASGQTVQTLHSNVLARVQTVFQTVQQAGGNVGSLVMSDGDATQRVLIGQDPVAFYDSVHVASGVFDPNNTQVTINFNGVAPVALRTAGTGIVELDQLSDELYVPNGDVFFEGGESVLTAGTVRVESFGGAFHATGAAYHSTGTRTNLDLDSIVVVNGGPNADQARFHTLAWVTGDNTYTTYLNGTIFVADSLSETFCCSAELIGSPGTEHRIEDRVDQFARHEHVALDRVVAGRFLHEQ
jgi:hypothetical protein